MDAAALIRRYYDAFNAGHRKAMIGLLAAEVAHDVNQGSRAVGAEAFAEFLAHMDRCYREQVSDLVVMATPDGRRAAAEFTVSGTYLASDPGLPLASGQTYSLPAGAFFELDGDRITRVTTYYNLEAWKRLVGG
jgi:steroid delta-isomerase-like uncharacterized protein